MKSLTTLKTVQISKWFGGLQALNNINIVVDCNEIVGIIGPNGSGKTTLFNVITGVYHKNDGQIFINNIEISEMSPHKITSLGIARTFQNIRLFPRMTVMDNILVGMHLVNNYEKMPRNIRDLFQERKEHENTEFAIELMKSLDLYNYRYQFPSSMPYGLQKKLEIARALATNPRILLLDEPAAGMNDHEKKELMDIVKNLKNKGYTVLLIEHDMRFVMGICDRLYAMDHGILIDEGTPEKIKHSPVVIDAYLGVSED